MNSSRTYVALLAAVTFWCLLIVLPPLAAFTPQTVGLAHFAYRVCAPACHQLDAHSLHLAGMKFAVCARCTGIYAGFAVATLLWGWMHIRLRRGERAAWLLAVAPMFLDVALDVLGVRSATLGSRLFSGSWFGIAAGLLLVPLLLEGLAELRRSFPLITSATRHEFHT
jgi:uncharacterized membrane protein